MVLPGNCLQPLTPGERIMSVRPDGSLELGPATPPYLWLPCPGVPGPSLLDRAAFIRFKLVGNKRADTDTA